MRTSVTNKMSQPEEILSRLLKNIIEEKNIKDAHVKITPSTSEGANYTSTLFKVKIISNNHDDLNLFGKVAVISDIMREQLDADKMFEMEVRAYTELLNRYEELQQKYGISEDDKYTFPKYYGSIRTQKEETIVLEDLSAQGYTMFSRHNSINWEYASKAIEALAKFHALWFAYKKEFSEEYERNYSSYIFNIPILEEADTNPFKQMCTPALMVAPSHLKDILENFIDIQFNESNTKKYYGPDKYGFLVHGDYRASNIVFKRQVRLELDLMD